jgi:hypothetical protein
LVFVLLICSLVRESIPKMCDCCLALLLTLHIESSALCFPSQLLHLYWMCPHFWSVLHLIHVCSSVSCLPTQMKHLSPCVVHLALTCPTDAHVAVVKHTLRYLNKTKTWTLFFPSKKPLTLEAYSDSGYANCLDTRRSFSSYIIQVAGCSVS